MTQEEALLLLLLLLSGPTVPGYANEGSVAGSCHCDKRIPSGSLPSPELMDHLQKHLRAYQSCPGYIRFQLPWRSVCGSVHAGWVQELLQCFDKHECGHAHRKDLAHHQHFPPHSTQTQESPDEELAGVHTTAQTNQTSTLQSIQIPGVPGNETTTGPENHSVGAGPEAWEDQKHLEESLGPAAKCTCVCTTATGAVLSLLTINLLLTCGVLICVLCKCRRQQFLRDTSDLHYVSEQSISMSEHQSKGFELLADEPERIPEAIPSYRAPAKYVRPRSSRLQTGPVLALQPEPEDK